MEEQEVMEILETVGAFRKGHFVLTSGRHSDSYINKDAIYPYTYETSRLCRGIAERFVPSEIDVVIGPAVGASILSQWVAYHLTGFLGKTVFGVYADKAEEGEFVIRRGFDKLMHGKKVLIVEDLMTTGGSVRKVVEAVRAAGGEVVGVAAICNRGDVTEKDLGDVPKVVSMVRIHLDSTEESECELCARGIPISTEVGHGKHFLARHAVSA